MVWRIWGDGEPVVLLHGGSGSWTHWIRNIPALEKTCRLYVADLPGLGDSDMPLRQYDARALRQSTDELAEIICHGLAELLPDAARFHLVGFSFGAVAGGYVARREQGRVRSFTMIGAAALGVPWSGLTGELLVVEDGMSPADILDVQRHNLHVIMMAAKPADIDDFTAWLQLENTNRARLRSHVVAPSDTLIAALRDVPAPMTVIWGAQDVFATPDMTARTRALRTVQSGMPVHVLENAGHWAMYEAADAVNALLL
ncbi:MAG: alpha/beta fold hydrolase, partial [Alphaproteobacteria bacterium]|nr:alpha/beta fold hydrolase [Alphaproteobacteria bacterium]